MECVGASGRAFEIAQLVCTLMALLPSILTGRQGLALLCSFTELGPAGRDGILSSRMGLIYESFKYLPKKCLLDNYLEEPDTIL